MGPSLYSSALGDRPDLSTIVTSMFDICLLQDKSTQRNPKTSALKISIDFDLAQTVWARARTVRAPEMLVRKAFQGLIRFKKAT